VFYTVCNIKSASTGCIMSTDYKHQWYSEVSVMSPRCGTVCNLLCPTVGYSLSLITFRRWLINLYFEQRATSKIRRRCAVAAILEPPTNVTTYLFRMRAFDMGGWSFHNRNRSRGGAAGAIGVWAIFDSNCYIFHGRQNACL